MNTAFRPGLPVGLIRLGLLASLLSASLQAAEPSPQYRLLVTSKTSTLQREIQAAAAQGYRVLAAWAGRDFIVVLEKPADNSEKYDYLLVAALRTSTLQSELKEAGIQGFRLLPSAVFLNESLTGPDGEELVLILEKAPGPVIRYDYRLLAAATDYDYVPGSNDSVTGELDRGALERVIASAVEEG